MNFPLNQSIETSWNSKQTPRPFGHSPRPVAERFHVLSASAPTRWGLMADFKGCFQNWSTSCDLFLCWCQNMPARKKIEAMSQRWFFNVVQRNLWRKGWSVFPIRRIQNHQAKTTHCGPTLIHGFRACFLWTQWKINHNQPTLVAHIVHAMVFCCFSQSLYLGMGQNWLLQKLDIRKTHQLLWA